MDEESKSKKPELPDFTGYGEMLKPKDVARIMSWTLDYTYRLFHSEDFAPFRVRTGKSALSVPKERFRTFMGYKVE